MGSVLHPVGDRPPQVYWVRRTIVLAVALVALVMLFMLFRPAPEAPVVANPAPTTVPPTSVEPTPTTESPSPTPTGPLVCDATNTKLSLAGFQKVKQDGKQVFKVALANSGNAACALDLRASTFSLAVTSGTDQIWSTGDCDKWVPEKKTTLKPGKTHEFSIEWKLTRSSAGCKQSKDPVKAGTYVAKATFAETATARQVFVVQKKA